MKKLWLFFWIIVVCVSLSACTHKGKTDNAVIDYGNSKKFNKLEIKLAIDTVLEKFKDFEGCTLTKLWYDEDKGKAGIEDNKIILYSNFDVDSTGGDGSFNPNSTYTDWNWILIRDNKTSVWEVKDWGYL